MPDAPVDFDEKKYLSQRFGAMETELSSWVPYYKDLSEFVQPRRGRFDVYDRNKGDKRRHKIINGHAGFAHQTARSGMMAGTMSPARPWFVLETYDPDLNEFAPVKQWLYTTTQIIRDVYASSNFYNQAPTLLGEMLLFGTGCMVHVDDFDDVARFYTHTAGSYMLAQNDKLKIDTMARKFQWQTKQIVGKFGYDNCSQSVRNAWDQGNYDSWFEVRHMIEPNTRYKRGNPFRKKFRSVYYEPGNLMEGGKQFLSEKGFDTFPAYTPRWETTDDDIYGTNCPAMVALGDIKGLQMEEKRKAQGIDKMVNPPLQGPASLRSVPVNSLAGGLTIYDVNDRNLKLSPIYQVTPQLQELRLDIDGVERRIDKAFFVDLFLAISQMEGIQPKNELDIMTRNEERLLMLGPVLEQLSGEFHDALISRTFDQLLKAGVLPPPPEALQGKPLRVRYVSSLAMAQKAVATQSIEKTLQFVGVLSRMGWQDVIDKIDGDQTVDEYAAAIGVPPRIIRSDQAVDLIRQQRQEAQQAQELMMAIQQGADAAKTAADADTEGKNALTDILGG